MDRRSFLKLAGLAGLGAVVDKKVSYFFAPGQGWTEYPYNSYISILNPRYNKRIVSVQNYIIQAQNVDTLMLYQDLDKEDFQFATIDGNPIQVIRER